jgi:cytochrome c2
VNGHLDDGTDMNAARNLVVVCQTCHDKHHAGESEIGPLKQTSDGPVRDLTRFVFKPSPETEEDIKRAQAVMRDYPHLPISRIMTDLEQRHGIRMSRQKLQGIRSKL